jgi:hypothetical protein
VSIKVQDVSLSVERETIRIREIGSTSYLVPRPVDVTGTFVCQGIVDDSILSKRLALGKNIDGESILIDAEQDTEGLASKLFIIGYTYDHTTKTTTMTGRFDFVNNEFLPLIDVEGIRILSKSF